MSNHSGSYMLNDILCLLEKNGFFADNSRKKNIKIFDEIWNIGFNYDCNSGEVFEEIGQRMGYCYCCRRSAKKLVTGLCSKCRE
jgi:hypothetical protein